ncbi:N utilization substance protein B [Betaproteobacteria bacterium]|nr:N utilization substance protein B [Betaproteobacteria bacterium]GHT92752.1 N utilization substance protein B [Betaproteobacteria bacterium]GHU04158.1 N utilization substance protein B [Betaproteobacteria bacterium]GHU13910.1 N utilization substance protein B [Betaproteobacteria bacterium]GHU20616.1 N utilization substance protein B [Betaproteobacteria bacterium]
MSQGERIIRRRARELALQGVYQWLLQSATPTGSHAVTTADWIDQPAAVQLAILKEFVAVEAEEETAPRADEVDVEFFTHLLCGTIDEAETLRARFAPFLSREVSELSPVEHAILLLAAHELKLDIATPYKVVINEAIELTKKYGGTDAHRFVNGVLDRLATELRPDEVKAIRATRHQD